MRYPKPAKDIPTLISLLKQRGLVIADEQKAAEFLRCVSFFRLKGYLLHFERKISRNDTHAVPAGTTFEAVMDLYELDRKLRLLMFEGVERIEIAFRSCICNTYAVGHRDPHWLLETLHFVDDVRVPNGPTFHERLLKIIRREIGVAPNANGETRDKEVFVQHYLDTYTEPELPPSWVLAECLSLGVWSQVYDRLAHRQGPLTISREFQVPPHVLGNWVHALSVVRNISAHHGRVWNRIFTVIPATLPGYDPHFKINTRFYAQAFVAAYLLRRVNPHTMWHIRMRDMMLSCPATEASGLGAPENWTADPFWSDAPLPAYAVKTLQPKS